MHTLQHVLRTRSLVVAHPDETVLDVARRMTDQRVGAVVVLEGDALVGIFSDRDLMTRVIVPGHDPARTRVSSVMTPDVVTASITAPTRECESKMRRAGCRHLPVLADGRVIAMLSMRDLLLDELEEQGAEIRELRAYIHQTPVEL